jgi:hypothetical protein
MLRSFIAVAAAVVLAGASAGAEPAHTAAPPDPPRAPAASDGAAVPEPTVAPYLRTEERDDGSVALAVSARTFVAADPAKPLPTVQLVGAIHIADRAYFESMQALLDQADVVLFEGVKPPGAGAFAPDLDDAGKAEATADRMRFLHLVAGQFQAVHGRAPRDLDELVTAGSPRFRSVVGGSTTDAWGRRFVLSTATTRSADDRTVPVEVVRLASTGPDGVLGTDDDVIVDGVPPKERPQDAGARSASSMQVRLADALGVAFQLDVIDSSKPSWRNSDLSIDEVRARLKAADADATAILDLLEGRGLQAAVAGLLLEVVRRSQTLAGIVKTTLIDTLAAGDPIEGRLAQAPGGRALAQVIVHERNDVVLADLDAIIAKEPAVRSIAVFYGAGHMDGLERGLLRRGYRVERETWTTAMSASPASTGLTNAQIKRLRATVRGMIERNAPERRRSP